MPRPRTRTLLTFVFVALALSIVISLQEHRFDSPHTGGVGTGLLVIVVALWEAARGKSSLVFRTVTKSDNPTLYWLSIFITVFVGLACAALSFV